MYIRAYIRIYARIYVYTRAHTSKRKPNRFAKTEPGQNRNQSGQSRLKTRTEPV